jgi:heme/copper-type cytochrome/quinol oxidase subunit 2
VSRRIPFALLVAVAGCRGALDQSMLEPSGPQAGRISTQFWFSFGVATAVYLLTVGLLFYALGRSRRRARDGGALPADAERVMTRGVAVGSGLTLGILLVFLFYDFSVGRVR